VWSNTLTWRPVKGGRQHHKQSRKPSKSFSRGIGDSKVDRTHNLLCNTLQTPIHRNGVAAFHPRHVTFWRDPHELCDQLVFRTFSLCMRNGRSETLTTKLSLSEPTWEFQFVFNICNAHENYNSTKQKNVFSFKPRCCETTCPVAEIQNRIILKNLDLFSNVVVLKHGWQYIPVNKLLFLSYKKKTFVKKQC